MPRGFFLYLKTAFQTKVWTPLLGTGVQDLSWNCQTKVWTPLLGTGVQGEPCTKKRRN